MPDFQTIFTVILLLSISGLFIYIWHAFSSSSSPPKKGSTVIPYQGDESVDCSSSKTLCNPSDPTSCQNCLNAAEMKCVPLNGENVCLPRQPDISCNTKNGGQYVWTGYGLTQDQEWQCLCTRPEIFNGPSCETPNPAYCSQGTIDISQYETNKICTCPNGTKMLLRKDNSPFCVSTDPTKGGGENGLYGNFEPHPDWRNVYFNTNTKDNTTWAQNIANEFGYNDSTKILAILNANNNPILTQTIVSQISALPGFKSSNTPFDPNYKPVVSYMYYQNVYLP